MLAPVAWRVPPLHYGPWERIVSILTEGLVARGVDVTLFATADSLTAGRLQAVVPRGYAEDASLDAKVYECLHVGAAFEQAAAGAFDILHNHFDFLPLTYSRLVRTPVVTTVHGFSSEGILPVYRAYNASTHLVAISAADRRADLRYAATIHHGIPLSEFTLRPEYGEYLLFFGRIHPTRRARGGGSGAPDGPQAHSGRHRAGRRVLSHCDRAVSRWGSDSLRWFGWAERARWVAGRRHGRCCI